MDITNLKTGAGRPGAEEKIELRRKNMDRYRLSILVYY
jgi:hypothetical protein